MAQMSRRTGFLLQGDDDAARVWDTNAGWQVEIERGHAVNPKALAEIRARFYYAAAPGERRTASDFDWQWDRADSPAGRWVAAQALTRAHPRSISRGPGWMLSPEGWLLVPSSLPAMTYEPVAAGAVVRHENATLDAGFPERGPARIAARTTARILLDRRELTNAYPRTDRERWSRRGRPPDVRRRRCTTRAERKAIGTTSPARPSSASSTSSSRMVGHTESSSLFGSVPGGSSKSTSPLATSR